MPFHRSALVLTLLAVLGIGAATQPPVPLDRARAAQRAGDRMQELMREAEVLATKQSKLLVELRTLENERRARTAEVERIETEIAGTQQQLAASAARAGGLLESATAERPDIEARLVQLYKLGPSRGWRMLLDLEDLRAVGRVYRTAAATSRITRDRVHAHQRTVGALARERKALEARANELAALQADAVKARAAVDRTVAARAALVDAIDAERDLNAQMASELQAAQQRIHQSLRQLEGGSAAAVALPLRPFRGVLPWPVRGSILTRFGRQPGSASVRHGIEIGVAEAQTVAAIHEGVVAFADQFTGYGTLVIVDHGDNMFSLYGHLGALHVARGDRVDARTPLGSSGRNPSGNPALYFELRVDGHPVDPLQWLQRIS